MVWGFMAGMFARPDEEGNNQPLDDSTIYRPQEKNNPARKKITPVVEKGG